MTQYSVFIQFPFLFFKETGSTGGWMDLQANYALNMFLVACTSIRFTLVETNRRHRHLDNYISRGKKKSNTEIWTCFFI